VLSPNPCRQAKPRWLAALGLMTLVALSGSANAASPAVATLAEPATVIARLGGADAEPALRLQVSPANRATGAQVLLRVFVNQPDADAQSPLGGVGFVGSFAFSPEADGPEEVGLPLAPELARLLRAPEAGPPTVTVVPVPLRVGAPASDGAVTVGEAVIEGL
jgi:hypothetical protein